MRILRLLGLFLICSGAPQCNGVYAQIVYQLNVLSSGAADLRTSICTYQDSHVLCDVRRHGLALRGMGNGRSQAPAVLAAVPTGVVLCDGCIDSWAAWGVLEAASLDEREWVISASPFASIRSCTGRDRRNLRRNLWDSVVTARR